MAFKKKFDSIEEEIVYSYCCHLEKGYPAKAWVFQGDNVCVDNLRKRVHVPEFEDKILTARASGVMTRVERLLNIMEEEDSRMASTKINVLKALEEMFFGEESDEIDSQDVLLRDLQKKVNSDI